MFNLHYQDETRARPPYATDAIRAVIGRDESCDLILLNPGVHGQHALIERTKTGYMIRDLGSPNGTRVNGHPVRDQRLASGDEIEVGSVRLRFEVVHAAPGLHRRTGYVQLLVMMVVIASILAQVGLIGWIFSQPRPDADRGRGRKHRHVRQPSEPDQPSTPILQSETPTAVTSPVLPRESSPAVAPAAAIEPVVDDEPEVLNRMIKIMGVTQVNAPDKVLLKISAIAQVGTIDLDAQATRVSVTFYLVDPAGQIQPAPGSPLWLDTSTWQNFQVRQFQVAIPVPPSRLAGYEVRSFYQDQVQDIARSDGLVPSGANPVR